MRHRIFLLLFLLALVEAESAAPSYEELAADFSSTPEEVISLGGAFDQNCTFRFNATPSNCNSLIAAYEADYGIESQEDGCGCYSFCNGQRVSCYEIGETPERFQCDLPRLVAGCQKGHHATSPLSPPNEQENQPCPAGYMCSKTKQRSCEEIRQIPIDLGLGDVHAGLYCPGTEDRTQNNYQNCDVGFYCPNSTSRLPCPEGYFCPHKTAQPEIVCEHCPEGATNMRRKPYGYIAVAILMIVSLVFLLYEIFKRSNAKLYAKLVDLRSRQMDSIKQSLWTRRRQEKLEKLKPKLEVIERRLEQRVGADEARSCLQSQPNGKIKFDAMKLFDLMDTKAEGQLTYSKINNTLELNAIQLREFIQRMNQVARVPPETEHIHRSAFVKGFVRVLEQISHFEPTDTETNQLFDDILLHHHALAPSGGEADASDEVPHESLYHGPLTEFLDDAQINELIRRFRALQEEQRATDMSLRRVPTFDGQPARLLMTFQQTRIKTITRDEFVAWYPSLLTDVTALDAQMMSRKALENGGVDIAFRDLSLTVKLKKTEVTIVDQITGRLKAGTMTALMGESGAGKTSLLNALCGRAHYGEVSGMININGHETSIEEHSSAVGFVPQDDIVYPELTVRENLIFSGKFQMPQGTPMQEIEDLADATMASLGLSRVMHSIVGDVHRRGISGGEKKRVNIGLELMAKPKFLALDEPTSGLDSNSALLVMSSLKNLATLNGTTICCVIHQPRKFIFELFDSLVLLGVGGKMVYHGPVAKAEHYFSKLQYNLPPGESVADWLIDIASGRLEPTATDEEQGASSPMFAKKKSALDLDASTTTTTEEEGTSEDDEEDSKAKCVAFEELNPEFECAFDSWEWTRMSPFVDPSSIRHLGESKPMLGDGEAVEFENDAAQAKSRRELLYRLWNNHVDKMSENHRKAYSAPEPFDLPENRQMTTFSKQFVYQVERLLLVWQRNWLSRIIDTALIVAAVVLIGILDGTVEATFEDNLNDLKYDSIAEPTDVKSIVLEFPKLFRYAITANIVDLQGHASKLGVMAAILVALSATKIITEHRKEFFREAGSGYNVNAYFFAINVVATVEHSIQIIICAAFDLWLRSTLSQWYTYIVSFLLLGWVAVSWALLFPLLVRRENMVLATSFSMLLTSFLFSGANPPIRFADIYNSKFWQVFCGILSPCRFFIEALAVVESRCLPVQSGFTNFGPNFRGEALQAASFQITGQALNDFGTVTLRSYEGWYWGALPALVVGLLIRWVAAGSIHVSDRSKQAKKSIRHSLSENKSGFLVIFSYIVVLVGLAGAATYLLLRDTSLVTY